MIPTRNTPISTSNYALLLVDTTKRLCMRRTSIMQLDCTLLVACVYEK